MAIYQGDQAAPETFEEPLDPDDVEGAGVDYLFDWANWLSADGDLIDTFTITPGEGLTVVSSALESASTAVRVWVRFSGSASQIGQKLPLECKIQTAVGNRPQTRTGLIYIQHR